MANKRQNAVVILANYLGTNNVPRVASLLKRGKIQYSTSGSPSCWSRWYPVNDLDDLEQILKEHEDRLQFGYHGIDFQIQSEIRF